MGGVHGGMVLSGVVESAEEVRVGTGFTHHLKSWLALWFKLWLKGGWPLMMWPMTCGICVSCEKLMHCGDTVGVTNE